MANSDDVKTSWNSSPEEENRRLRFQRLYEECPIPLGERLMNLELFMKRQDLSGVLFFNEIYQRILNVHGIVCEFGVRWGRRMALLESLRGIYEPFNHNRKIVGFDTFEGFPAVSDKDGQADIIAKGSFNVTADYDAYLSEILDYHESESPISHIKKYELVKGDASIEVKKYFDRNPHSVIAMAYFDFDIYKPTYDCLVEIRERLTKGSVVGFDELNCKDYPGETLALKEVFGLGRYPIRHSMYSPTQSYITIE